jgi:hypothetical protein
VLLGTRLSSSQDLHPPGRGQTGIEPADIIARQLRHELPAVEVLVEALRLPRLGSLDLTLRSSTPFTKAPPAAGTRGRVATTLAPKANDCDPWAVRHEPRIRGGAASGDCRAGRRGRGMSTSRTSTMGGPAYLGASAEAPRTGSAERYDPADTSQRTVEYVAVPVEPVPGRRRADLGPFGTPRRRTGNRCWRRCRHRRAPSPRRPSVTDLVVRITASERS